MTLTQLAIANYLSSGAYQRHLGKLQQTFKQQVFLLREAVARYFPTGTRISDPQGGFVLWVQLPVPVDILLLADRVMGKKISIVPGMMFTAGLPANTSRRYFSSLLSKQLQADNPALF